MSFLSRLKIIKKIELQKAYNSLVEKAKLDFDFIFLLCAGVATCSLGMSINSSPVIIGSMIISPMLYTILVLPVSLLWKDTKVFVKNLTNLFYEVLIAGIVSILFAFILQINPLQTELVTQLSQNPLVYFAVALIAGSAAALNLFWPSVSEELTGVAISVTLVPPLAIIGVGIVNMSGEIFLTALSALFANLFGIMIGAFLILFLFKKRN
jgi:uncharacterized hydrophobic protein (TIGR00271 family)